MEGSNAETVADDAAQAALHDRFRALREELATQVIGQADLVERLLIALLADGHLLVEGAPGLAKTTAVKALATRIEANFQRVQFTPDLLPSDLTGTDIWRQADGRFEFQPGPLFHNLLLADEINRAPAKVQSALPQLFLVMATQNPIEQEGTYPLPEAQLDRFLMHVRVGYPEAAAETAILRLVREQARSALRAPPAAPQKLTQAEVLAAREAVLDLHFAPELERYLVELVLASRDARPYDPTLARRIAWGASPRGSIALERCARARAWLAGRDYVTPEDIHAIAPDVLRHRVLPSYEATAEGWDGGRLVGELLQRVPLP
jgi:MoxR-like ATPase